MKILCIADGSLKSPSSGLEQVLYQQATGLYRNGAEVFCITRSNEKPGIRIGQVDGVTEGCICGAPDFALNYALRIWGSARRLYRCFLSDRDFDAVIVHQPITYLTLPLAWRCPKVPMLYVFHSPWHQEYLIKMRGKRSPAIRLAGAARRKIEGICLGRAVRTMTLSRYMLKTCINLHGLSPGRVAVNPGGADTERFKPPFDRIALKLSHNLPLGKVHLLTIRNLEPRMGIDSLIKALGVLKQESIAAHLLVGGDGPERANLEELACRLGIDDRVKFIGFIHPDRMAEVYGTADFFILPTRELEGFGLITPEAMACGTPVLGTPVGGTIEILKAFDPSFLFFDTSAGAIAEGIRQVLRRYSDLNGARYLKLRERCRRYVLEHYSWQRHVARLSEVIDAAVHR